MKGFGKLYQFASSNTLFPQVGHRYFSHALSGRRVLVTGCNGQIGIPLVQSICNEVGSAGSVLATDLGDAKAKFNCDYQSLDITDADKYNKMVKDNKIDYIVHLAAILSATGELYPDKALNVNVNGTITALNIAREHNCRVFVPSTIAVFGGDKFQKDNTPVHSILQPTTMYGVSKVFTEQLGTYYNKKFGVDFRCIRYPGVISSEKYAFNGTAMYSTQIFFEALEKGTYKCFLKPNTFLPMIYIDDCIKATTDLLKADTNKLNTRVYNLAGISFSPEQIAAAVKKYIPDFKIEYEPDFRQAIAESWPRSVDDKESGSDWGWKYDITLDEMVKKTLIKIDEKYKKKRRIVGL